MDLFKKFEEIKTDYINQFNPLTINVPNRAALMTSIDRFPGVYIIHKGGEVIYIGSSGKVTQNLNFSASTVKSRITNSYTPYKLDGENFLFQPMGTITGTNIPERYGCSFSLSEIEFTCIDLTPANGRVIAPAALEHFLLQAYINQHKSLPLANQKI